MRNLNNLMIIKIILLRIYKKKKKIIINLKMNAVGAGSNLLPSLVILKPLDCIERNSLRKSELKPPLSVKLSLLNYPLS